MSNAIDRLFSKGKARVRPGREKISNKIAFLIREEGKKPNQAVAIANSLFRRRKL